MPYEYSDAGKNAPDEVREAIENFHEESEDLKSTTPLLYYLLGDGTPPYKMSKTDSAYQDKPKQGRNCANCLFLYHQPLRSQNICSKIRGKVDPNAWCKFWKGLE